MKKAIIFGSTGTGKQVYNAIKHEYEVICFLDENNDRIGQELFSLPIKSKDYILECEYDFIFIAVLTRFKEIRKILLDLNVPEYKIISKYVEIPTLSRIEFVKNVSEIFKELNISGSVAELGVYQGEFAHELSLLFNDRKLYLFDTFEGLPQNDVEFDNEHNLTEVGGGESITFQILQKKLYFLKYRIEIVVLYVKDISQKLQKIYAIDFVL